MGAKVHCESYFSGYSSMRGLNENSNSCSWPLYYGDNSFTNAQYYNGFLTSTIVDVYPGNNKDAVKRTMLEHEAIFKNQLYELHRLYRIQRDLMDEIKRKELHKNRMPVETSLSSSPLASQITSEEARKWHIPGFPMPNSLCARPSTSGVEEMHSPLSSMKGSSVQASPMPSQNGGTSKSVEMLESRPTKVRRKMFDLQLPADEYMDTEEGEHFRDANASGISTNRDCKFAPESGTNLFPSNGAKNSFQGDAVISESCIRSSKTNMADLNKPIENEETDTSAYCDVGCGTTIGEDPMHELTAKSSTHFVGFPKEINSLHGSNSGVLRNSQSEDYSKETGWFNHIIDSGHGKNNPKPVSQCRQPEKLPQSNQPYQVLFNKTREPPGHFVANQIKGNQFKEKMACGLDLSERDHERPQPIVTCGTPSPYPITPSSDVGKPWSDVVFSWEKPGGSLRIQPFTNSSATVSRSSQASVQNLGFFGDQWNYNGTLASGTNFGGEVPHRNGFYHGSSSVSKEPVVRLSSDNCDYWNCSSGNAAVASEHLINHCSLKFRSPNSRDLKSSKDVNLNMELSNSVSNKRAQQKELEVIDLERKQEDPVTALPWLRTKSVSKNETIGRGVDLNAGELGFLQSSPIWLSNQNKTTEDPNQTVTQNRYSTSCSDVLMASQIERSNSSSCRKILGIPIFGKPINMMNESSSLTSPSVTLPRPFEVVGNTRRERGLDINLPCDMIVPDCGQQTTPEVMRIEKDAYAKVTNFRPPIDLNSCVAEDEASLMPVAPCSNIKAVVGIDLEAPVVPETEECSLSREGHTHDEPLQLTHQKAESPQDELAILAAETIVAISSFDHSSGSENATCSSPEVSMTDPLHWFVEIVSTCGVDLESELDVDSRAVVGKENDSCLEGFDYFVSMTLKLTETKEEDYMPKPLVPENLKMEETGTTPLLTRTRKGPGRRGRQRRDFQRDILPGLASLSRHEVTEDMQTFGGLMRATGQLWHSGLTRRNSTRNGCARGRRRKQVNSSSVVTMPPPPPPCIPLIQQLNNIEVGLEDRSLAGWGKTTRRPRRQRCPAGNPPSVPLT